jgi:hypothetical protein
VRRKCRERGIIKSTEREHVDRIEIGQGGPVTRL